MWILFTVVVAVVILLFAIAYHFTNVSYLPKKWALADTYEKAVEKGQIDPQVFEAMEKEEISVPSAYGYDLDGLWMPVEDSNRTAIICHGYTMNKFGSMKYTHVFRRMGFNVLIYDHQFHGKSGGDLCTMGFREKNDLKTMVDWLEKKVGLGGTLVTHGESMGGGTVLMHAAMDHRVSAVVSDCAFADTKDVFAYRLKADYGLPAFPLLYMASFISKLRVGAYYYEISPWSVIDQVTIPVLFINGTADDYVPMSHTATLFDRKPGVKELHMVEGAGHALAYEADPGAYEAVVEGFLLNHVLAHGQRDSNVHEGVHGE